MKFNPSFLVISILISFLFAAYECHVISRRDVDETVQKAERQDNQKIKLSEQKHFEGDIMLPGNRPFGQIQSAVYEDEIWPNKTIPYVISKIYTKAEVNLILDAMKAFKNKTCIRFIPRTTEEDYIDIKKTGDGCYSYAGIFGGNQTVSLDDGCLYPDTIKHELMHAVGFYHEQSRTDRDDYVNIIYDNIRAGEENQFTKYDSETVRLLGTAYDLKSIMHYGWNYFAIDYTKPTMTDKKGNKVGPAADFTLTDILDLNRLYKCQDGPYIKWMHQEWKNAVLIWAPNCDIAGKFIRRVRSKRGDCGGLCAVDLKCTRFTWDSTGFCTLKTGPELSPETRQHRGAMCGYISEGNSNFQWKDFNKGQEKRSNGCDFPGNDIRTVNRGTPTCFSLCISEPKCTSYAERMDPGSTVKKCYLKTGKSPIARSAFTDDKNAYCSMISARI